ncbi:hypothetical protein LTR87_016705 [Friedmanniomyces endolithicus]|nr:hypothetical protein LTR87_016705 [Friedmanniomyces endolithicus]
MNSGARVFYAYAIHSLMNSSWTIADQMRKFASMSSEGLYKNSTVSLGLAYDFFFASDKELTNQVLQLARVHNASVLTSHYVGGPFLGKKLDNSPEVLDQFGAFETDTPVILSHAAGLTEEGREIMRQRNQYIATTPESELQLLFDTQNSTRLLQDQGSLGIATNFGFTADLMTQARLWLQRVRGLVAEPIVAAGYWPSTNPMSVNQAFLMATRHGGLALRRND